MQVLSTGAGGVTVVAPPQVESHLPIGMILENSQPPTETALQQFTVHTLEQLEAVILDMNGQIAEGRRVGGNSWKRFTLWKWKSELVHELEMYQAGHVGSLVGPRGPREKQGTLFYLRGAYLS